MGLPCRASHGSHTSCHGDSNGTGAHAIAGSYEIITTYTILYGNKLISRSTASMTLSLDLLVISLLMLTHQLEKAVVALGEAELGLD